MRHITGCIRKEKERKVIHRETRGRRTWVVRTRIVKSHITRDAQATTYRIPTSIALVLIAIAKEDTLNRLSSQFGAFSGGKKNIAYTSKHTKSGLVGRATSETLHRNTTLKSSRWLNVDEIGGCGNSLSPKMGWKGSNNH